MILTNLGDLTQVEMLSSSLCHCQCNNVEILTTKTNPPSSWTSCRAQEEIATHFLLLTSVSQAVDMVTQLEAWCKSFLKWHFQLTLPCHFGPESAHMHRGHWFTDSLRKCVSPFVKSSAEKCEPLTWEFNRLRPGQRAGGDTAPKPESTDWSDPRISSELINYNNNNNNKAFHFRGQIKNHVGVSVWPRGWGAVPMKLEHLQGKTHTYTHTLKVTELEESDSGWTTFGLQLLKSQFGHQRWNICPLSPMTLVI